MSENGSLRGGREAVGLFSGNRAPLHDHCLSQHPASSVAAATVCFQLREPSVAVMMKIGKNKGIRIRNKATQECKV